MVVSFLFATLDLLIPYSPHLGLPSLFTLNVNPTTASLFSTATLSFLAIMQSCEPHVLAKTSPLEYPNPCLRLQLHHGLWKGGLVAPVGLLATKPRVRFVPDAPPVQIKMQDTYTLVLGVRP